MAPNPKLFRELSEPFGSLAEANEAVTAFFEELGELRKKHGLVNVLVVVADSALTEDGQREAEFMVPLAYGDHSKQEALAAYAMGQAAQERQEYIGTMMSGKAVTKVRPK